MKAKPHLILLFVFPICLLLASCNKCKNVPCLNGGACEDGTCICPEGFSGTNCETEDRCYTKNVHCLNGGTCFDGMCECPEGFTGINCETEIVESDPVSISELVGVYLGEWACDPNADTVTISLGNASSQLEFFENDYGFGYYANVSQDLKSFEVPYQEYSLNSGGYAVDGSGTFSNSGVDYTINYQFANDSLNFSCSFSGNK